MSAGAVRVPTCRPASIVVSTASNAPELPSSTVRSSGSTSTRSSMPSSSRTATVAADAVADTS